MLVVMPDTQLAAQIERVVTSGDLRCRCVCVQSAHLALARDETHPTDLVIASAPLPDMEPCDLIAALRAKPAQAGVLFVCAVEKTATPEIAEGALLSGADDVLTVPATDAVIRRKIRLALRLKEAEDRVRAYRARVRALNSEQAALLRKEE